MDKTLAIELVKEELDSATSLYSTFHNYHEGVAVIEEEFIELRNEVFLQPNCRDVSRMKQEAIQVAAMALRFIVDLT